MSSPREEHAAEVFVTGNGTTCVANELDNTAVAASSGSRLLVRRSKFTSKGYSCAAPAEVTRPQRVRKKKWLSFYLVFLRFIVDHYGNVLIYEFAKNLSMFLIKKVDFQQPDGSRVRSDGAVRFKFRARSRTTHSRVS